MKANELRIGNYVYDLKHKRFVQFHSIDSSWNFIYVNYSNGFGIYTLKLKNKNLQNKSEIDFIPLTEEILLKCGAKKKKYNIMYISIKGFTIEFELIKNTIYGSYLEMIGLDIQYLHELQNLYFALTQKELEIKL